MDDLELARRLIGALPQPSLVLDGGGEVLAANPAAADLWGVEMAALVGRPLARLLGDPPVEVGARLSLWTSSEAPAPVRVSIVREGGITEPVHAQGRLIRPASADGPALVLLQCRPAALQHGTEALTDRIRELEREVDRRRRLETWLRERKERERLLLSSTNEAIYGQDLEGRCTFANDACARMLGYADPSEIIGADMHALIHHSRPDGSPYPVSECKLEATHRHRAPIRISDEVFWRKDGSCIPVEYQCSPLHDSSNQVVGAVVVFNDITERRDAEQKIASSLRAKELLLQELNHRVKNNLQIIISLQSLQASSIQDPEVRAVLETSQDRVRTLALLHEALYQGPDLDRIDVREYVRDLIRHLSRSLASDTTTVRCEIHVDDPLVSLEHAVSIGLIVNELVSNATKHAFPEGRSGTVVVELRGTPNVDLELRVRDDGVGASADALVSSGSLGLRLVGNLAEQLGCTVTFDSSDGMDVRVATTADALGELVPQSPSDRTFQSTGR